uniref:Uncharacterized protein n=1 Tax=Anguilla anguilla TaxID=7936 RepID=A0A0E9WHS0_ANGAN
MAVRVKSFLYHYNLIQVIKGRGGVWEWVWEYISAFPKNALMYICNDAFLTNRNCSRFQIKGLPLQEHTIITNFKS